MILQNKDKFGGQADRMDQAKLMDTLQPKPKVVTHHTPDRAQIEKEIEDAEKQQRAEREPDGISIEQARNLADLRAQQVAADSADSYADGRPRILGPREPIIDTSWLDEEEPDLEII